MISDKDSKYSSRVISYLITAHLALGLDLEAEQYENMLAEGVN